MLQRDRERGLVTVGWRGQTYWLNWDREKDWSQWDTDGYSWTEMVNRLVKQEKREGLDSKGTGYIKTERRTGYGETKRIIDWFQRDRDGKWTDYRGTER